MRKTTFLASSATSVLIAAAAGAADSELLVFDWSGYEDPEFHADYIDAHGASPSYAFFGDEEEAFQKLRSGFRADVSRPCAQAVRKWRDADLVEPWDTARVAAFDALEPAFLASPDYADDTGVYFLPVDWGATAIAYNTDEVPAEDVASLDVFLNPAYAGRISLPDVVDDTYALAFLATGKADWTDATMDDLAAASDWLRQAHANVRTYWTDGAELGQLMQTGEVLVSWAWNETPTTLSADGAPIGYQREPAEGSTSWFCGFVNLKDGPGSEDKLYDFVNAWYAQNSVDVFVNDWGYGNANTAAMAEIPDETLVEVGLGPIDAPLHVQLPMDRDVREAMIAEFEKIKAGF